MNPPLKIPQVEIKNLILAEYLIFQIKINNTNNNYLNLVLIKSTKKRNLKILLKLIIFLSKSKV